MAWEKIIFVIICMTVMAMGDMERKNDDSKEWLYKTKICTVADKESGICTEEEEVTKKKIVAETTYFETVLPSNFPTSEHLTMDSSSSSDSVVSIPSCPLNDPDCDLSSHTLSTNPFMTYSKRNYDPFEDRKIKININNFKNTDRDGLYVMSNGHELDISYEQFMKIISLIYFTPTPTTTTTTTTTTTLPTTPKPPVTTTTLPTTQAITTEEVISTTLSTIIIPPSTPTTTTSTTTTTTNEPIEAQLQRELQKGISWYQSDMKWAVLVGGVAALLTIILLIITIITIRSLIANKQQKRLNEYQLTMPHKETVTYKEPYGYPSYV